MEKQKLALVIERGEGKTLWGSVTFNDNLLTDFAESVLELENKLKNLLLEFEGLRPESLEFEHFYDVYALFKQYDFLNISKVAERAGLNPGLLRQYASQVKTPSVATAQKIENVIHQLASEMKQARLVV